MNRKPPYRIGLLMWDRFLREFLPVYLELKGCLAPLQLEIDSYCLHASFLDQLKRLDLLITEAYNPNKFRDPEGFRLAYKFIELRIPIRSLIIFRSLDERFLQYPFFVDYASFYTLDEKIDEIMEADGVAAEPFMLLAEACPELLTIPVHRES